MMFFVIIIIFVGGAIIGYAGGRIIENKSWLNKIGKKMQQMDEVIKNLKPPVK